MTSKRELETKLEQVDEWRINVIEQRNDAEARLSRYKHALMQVAKHYGFHDAYVREERFLVDPSGGYAYGATGIRHVFSPDALIADLDTIDQARSADEARARLGIGGNECEREQEESGERS